MKILPEMIRLLNKEEVRGYKLFANRTNASNDRKDILLFDYFKKYPGVDENKIFSKLYGNKDKNSFYRLKNRLMEDIGMSLSLLHYNSSDVNTVLNNYLLAKLFIPRSKWDIALYYLGRAEKKALAIEGFELLDMIYNEYIKLSQEVLDINPEEYIKKRQENRKQLNRLQEIDDVLAAVIYRVKVSQNFGKGNERINELLSKTVNTYANSQEIKNSPLLRFKIYHSLSRLLLQQHNYKALEKYLLKTYTEFNKEKLFTKNNHDTRLQMLTYICNTLFRNGKNSESLDYAGRLYTAMQEYDQLLFDKYLFYYYNILVNNYAKTNVEKAIEILNEAKDRKVIQSHPVYIGFVYLNLAVSYFGIKDFKAALRSIVKLYMLDSYKSLDAALRFKISVAELIIRYELHDPDYIEQRIAQLKKEFRKEFTSAEFENETGFIRILLMLLNTSSPRSDKKVLQSTREFISVSRQKVNSEEQEIINYADWLSGKLNLSK
jgi:tetratricopeptide (TPR) repeat protein